MTVRLLVIFGLEFRTIPLGICRKDNDEFESSKKFSAVVDHDAGEVF